MSFTDPYNYITPSGVIIPDTSKIVSQTQSELNDRLGGIEITPESPAGRLVEMIAQMFSTVIGINAQNANQYNLDFASGQFLDAIASNFMLSRKGSSRSRVEVTLTGEAGTTIPAGSLAMTEDTRQTFSLDTDVTLPSPDGGALIQSATGWMTATEDGPVACNVGQLTIIQTRVNGWNSIVNNSAAQLGTVKESDTDLRNRIKASKPYGRCFTESCYARIMEISGVSSCAVLENGYGYEKLINGVVLSPHSIFVCVDGYGESNKDAIARAIYETKTCGCGFTDLWSGNDYVHRINVTDENTNAQYTMIIHTPESLACTVKVNTNVTSYNAKIKDLVSGYCSSIPIGGKLNAFDLAKYLISEIPDMVISDIRFEDGTHTDMLEVSCPSDKKISVGVNNVSVNGIQ